MAPSPPHASKGQVGNLDLNPDQAINRCHMLHWVVSEKAKKTGGIFTPLAGVSKAHMGCLHFYSHTA